MNKPERTVENPQKRQILPARKLHGKVAQVLKASGSDFISWPVERLELDFSGIKGDFHAGISRRSGSREPWYSRGTAMRNERQVSILSVEELSQIAADLDLQQVDAGWIGGNLVLQGISDLSFLPPRTQLFFEGGATLRIDGYNAPCRLAGGSIAKHADAPNPTGDWSAGDMALAFKNAAQMKRGLVAWVEKEGSIVPGENVSVRVWEQWIY